MQQNNVKLLSAFAVMLCVFGVCMVAMGSNESDAATHGSASNPLTSLSGSLDSYAGDTVYLEVGSSVSLSNTNDDLYWCDASSVSSGYGLSLTGQASFGQSVSGTISRAGTITIGLDLENEDGPWTDSITIIAVSASTPVSSVTISGSTSGTVGSTITLTATTSPSSADDRTVTWSITSGSTRASITSTTDTSSGGRAVISLESAGSVTVRATASDGSGEYDTHTITITEPEVLVTSVSISGSTSMEVGESITLTATTSPTNANDRTVYWQVTLGSTRVSISESDTTTGGRCTVQALSAGTVVIRAYANDGSGEYGSHTITISEPEVLVSSVSITGSTSVAVGSSITLTATTSPTNADVRHVTWSITNGSGHVSNTTTNTSTGGTITLTGLSAGTVTVRATAADGSGASDTHTITVYTPSIDITSTQGDVTLITGQEFSTVIQTNVSGCTISVSGASWLSASGSTVSGTAPSSPGTYNVTITASHSNYQSDSISFEITVVSALSFTNEPSNGVTVYVVA